MKSKKKIIILCSIVLVAILVIFCVWTVKSVLHGILMLGDMLLMLSLNDISRWSCFILSIVLFLVTGIYLMLLQKRWQGIVVALFSLIAWIQPVFFFVCQQLGNLCLTIRKNIKLRYGYQVRCLCSFIVVNFLQGTMNILKFFLNIRGME